MIQLRKRDRAFGALNWFEYFIQIRYSLPVISLGSLLGSSWVGSDSPDLHWFESVCYLRLEMEMERSKNGKRSALRSKIHWNWYYFWLYFATLTRLRIQTSGSRGTLWIWRRDTCSGSTWFVSRASVSFRKAHLEFENGLENRPKLTSVLYLTLSTMFAAEHNKWRELSLVLISGL